MKVNHLNGMIELVPENKKEIKAISAIKYQGIEFLQMCGDLPNSPILKIALGKDYIANYFGGNLHSRAKTSSSMSFSDSSTV